MLPTITVEGRVVGDPELRFSAGGMAIGSFRLVADQKKNVNGEWVDDKVLWMPVTCFKQLAENCAESLAKGDLVMVTGKLQTEEWESNGEKKSRVTLIANNVGPSLMFRHIPHGGSTSRVERSTAPADDKWSSGGEAASQTDEPPF